MKTPAARAKARDAACHGPWYDVPARGGVGGTASRLRLMWASHVSELDQIHEGPPPLELRDDLIPRVAERLEIRGVELVDEPADDREDVGLGGEQIAETSGLFGAWVT